MTITSSAFINTLRFGSYLVQARCTVYQNGAPTEFIVPVSTAKITITRYAAQRRSGNLVAELTATIPPVALMPTGPTSVLAPFGNEIFVEAGVQLNTTKTGLAAASGTADAGTTLYVPLGMFAIATTTVEDTTVDLIVTLSLFDRSWIISQRAFKKPYRFPAVTGNFVAEITHLLNQVWGTNKPALQYNMAPTTATVPVASYNQGSDPWQAALDMANATGQELYFNAYGVVTAHAIPTPRTQPVVWNFTDSPAAILGLPGTGSNALFGDEYTTPVSIKMTMTRTRIYNDVIVTGTGTYNTTANTTAATGGVTAPVLAEAADTNPFSATYINGPLGDIPEFVSSNMITSSAQAQETADNTLAIALSAAWQITIEAPPNPIFDVDHVVTVTRPRIGQTSRRMVIDTVTHTIGYATVLEITGRVVPSV